MYNEDQNPFKILGLEPRFDLDEKKLEQAYFALQAVTHPDRFVYHSQPEKDAAALQSSRLNNAYETLRKAPSRAKALLELQGINLKDESAKSIQDPQVLEEIMELQEAILHTNSPHDEDLLETQIQDSLKEVTTRFATSLKENQLDALEAIYLRLIYLSKILEDLRLRRRQSSLKAL